MRRGAEYNYHIVYCIETCVMGTTDERLRDRIAKIEQEIAALNAATARKLAELQKKRKPLVKRKRSRDRANDTHCLALYASTALALVGAGDAEAHEFTKKVLRELRKTQRHRESLRLWPRLEKAFSGYQTATGRQTGVPTPSGDSNDNQESNTSRDEPSERNAPQPPDVTQ